MTRAYDREGLWATLVDGDTARLDNVPFLQDGVAQGVVVRFEADASGTRWARERVESSGHCVIRVLPVKAGPLGPDAAAVHAQFAAFGLGGEVFSQSLPLVAFDVPPDAELAGVKALLEAGQTDGWWHYEVGCGTDRWAAAWRLSHRGRESTLPLFNGCRDLWGIQRLNKGDPPARRAAGLNGIGQVSSDRYDVLIRYESDPWFKAARAPYRHASIRPPIRTGDDRRSPSADTRTAQQQIRCAVKSNVPHRIVLCDRSRLPRCNCICGYRRQGRSLTVGARHDDHSDDGEARGGDNANTSPVMCFCTSNDCF